MELPLERNTPNSWAELLIERPHTIKESSGRGKFEGSLSLEKTQTQKTANS